MYNAKVILNGTTLKGTLDFYVISNTKQELLKLGIDKNIPDIFKGIAELDMTCISALLIQSIIRVSNIKESEITQLYSKEKTLEDMDNNFMSIFSFINELMAKCMPKVIEENESVFEDEEEETSSSNWDIAFMEYQWTTTLKRANFWGTTPKNFFEQIDIYKKINGIKEEKFEEI